MNISWKRVNDITGFKLSEGRYLALHSRNLEIAEIDQTAWEALTNSEAKSEAAQELRQWNDESDADVITEKAIRKPRVLLLNIAQICNLKCGYCAAGGDGTYGSEKYQIDLSAAYQQIESMAKKLEKGEALSIHFLGGEPLLYPKAIRGIASYAQLMAAGLGLKLQFAVTTNGTLLTEAVIELLADIRCRVVISLDGPPEINNLTRPAKRKDHDSTQMTVEGIERLLKVRERLGGFSINSVFGEHNTGLLATYLFVRQWRPDIYNFGFAPSKNDRGASLAFTREVRRVVMAAYEFGGWEEVYRIGPVKNHLLRLQNRIRTENFCGAGKSLLEMDTKGDLYACNWFMNDEKEKIGRSGHIDQEKIAAYSKDLIDLNNCRSCWARFFCGGGCMFSNKEKTGDKHGKDLDFCQRMREMVALAAELFVYQQKSEAPALYEI